MFMNPYDLKLFQNKDMMMSNENITPNSDFFFYLYSDKFLCAVAHIPDQLCNHP